MDAPPRVEARFYEKTGWDNVTCHLCPHSCSIAASRSGTCGVRSNRGGQLFVDNWGKVASVDYVYAEDLPLFHYKPGINWVRLSGRGCTMRCPFCCTWRFSQAGGVRTVKFLPADAIPHAEKSGSRGISFGVNDPAPLHEFVYDVFQAALEAGLETHVATGGMWNEEPLREIARVTRAFTFSLKGLDETFHQIQLGANLASILGGIRMLLAQGSHVEIAWLLIPGHTDSAEQAERLLSLMAGLDHQVPLIILPYQPEFTWRDHSEAATLGHLRAFRELLGGALPFVYIHHPESVEMNTRCTHCSRTLVRRGLARQVITSTPDDGSGATRCPSCATAVPFVPEA